MSVLNLKSIYVMHVGCASTISRSPFCSLSLSLSLLFRCECEQCSKILKLPLGGMWVCVCVCMSIAINCFRCNFYALWREIERKKWKWHTQRAEKCVWVRPTSVLWNNFKWNLLQACTYLSCLDESVVVVVVIVVVVVVIVVVVYVAGVGCIWYCRSLNALILLSI